MPSLDTFVLRRLGGRACTVHIGRATSYRSVREDIHDMRAEQERGVEWYGWLFRCGVGGALVKIIV